MKLRLFVMFVMLGLVWTSAFGIVQDHRNLPALPSYPTVDPTLVKSSPQWGRFVATTAPGWKAIWSDGSSIPAIVFGSPIPVSNLLRTASEALGAGERFLSEHGELFGVEAGGWIAGTPVKVNRIWMLLFREMIGGVPVFGGRIDLRINDQGELIAIYVRTHPGLQASTIPALSKMSCLANLAASGLFPSSLEMDDGWLEILPIEDNAYLCWRLDIRGPEPNQRWTAWMDAHSGILRAADSRVITDQVSGYIQGEALPHYWNDPLVTYPFPWENVQVEGFGTVSDSGGYYEITVPGSAPYDISSELSGLYVNVNYDDGPDASYDVQAPSSPHNWTWTDAISRTDERNLYYHTNLVHDFYKGLDPDFSGMDYPVPAVCEYGNHYENAFWNGYGTYYGGGGTQFRSFALFCDVIYHEYTHGVTDQIYPSGYLPYIDQSGAMNEAWSDYFACTITNEPLIGEGGLYQSGSLYMRNLDNTLRYPENWMGEVHADGRIIGGAFWDLRERVGAAVSDHLLHFSKYGLAEEFLPYFIDVLLTDDNDGNIANGSPHSFELYESFGIHGVGPGVIPNLRLANYSFNDDAIAPSFGNGNGFMEAGETVELSLAIENQGMLYPPPAENVTVTVNSLNEHITVTQGQTNIGNLASGHTRWISTPMVLQIASSTPDEFAYLEVIIQANGGQVTARDTIETMLGLPRVLLADDDGDFPYENYYENALHAANQTYVKRNVSNGVNPDDLAMHPIVIWFCGDQRTQTVTDIDQSRLSNHLANGGRLILTGQNVGEDIHQTTFFQDILGAIHTDDSLHYRLLDGVPGDPLGGDRWLLLAGASGAQNQNSVAGSHAGSNAIEFYRYRDDPNQRAGAIRREDPSGYRTIYFSFGLEGISGLSTSTSLADFLEICLGWLDEGMWAPPVQDVPTPLTWSLQPPYPNPFNPTTVLEFTVPTVSDGMIAVYDLLGRRVGTVDVGPWSVGSHRIIWNAGSLPSGNYFLRLEAPGIQKVQKVILLK